jgi:hypothetical protein
MSTIKLEKLFLRKPKNMTPRMFTNEALAQFFAAGGAKPVAADTLLHIQQPFRNPAFMLQFCQ